MSTSFTDLNLNHWFVKTTEYGSTLYVCKVCINYKSEHVRNCISHERSQAHQESVRHAEVEGGTDLTSAPVPVGAGQIVQDDSLRHLISAMYSNVPSNPPLPPYPPNHPSLVGNTVYDPRNDHWDTSAVTGIPWGVGGEDFHVEAENDQDLLTNVLNTVKEILDLELSDDEPAEWSEPDDTDSGGEVSDDCLSGFEEGDDEEDGPRKRVRGQQSDPRTARLWFPWEDRLTCTLDLLMHLPRSVFSQRQLELFLWLLRVNGIDYVPSTKTMKNLNKTLQKVCGIDKVEYEGILGNRYFVNNLSQILAQEMANPLVRRHLDFYPEDRGKHVSQAAHGTRWREEMTHDDLTPMIRRGETDYFIHEPAMLVDQSLCIPFRWFRRGRKLWAKAWAMEVYTEIDGDGFPQRYWRVREDQVTEVMEDTLWKNLPTLQAEFRQLGIPKPSLLHHIYRIREDGTAETGSWEYTKPTEGNPWRVLAQGRRVMALPLWMYCDDTSGNVSKRWNEHNSFLFTLAGLPMDQVTKEFNIHFLCTSNIAPPLEMLDGVVSQIELARKNGVWAWDCVHNELVLVFPAVLALLGDNPMQSELASHIGMGGKYFCRVCWVHGADPKAQSQDSNNNHSNMHSTPSSPFPDVSPLPSSPSVRPVPLGPSTQSFAGQALLRPPTPVLSPVASQPPRTANLSESMSSMVERIRRFIKGAKPRNRHETERKLESYLEWAQQIGNLTDIREEKTATGVKDTILDHFLEKLHRAYKSVTGSLARQEALDAAVRSLPTNVFNPIFRLKGLDPHQDTPVEILHVVLLGIVKYFWRDLVHNQLDKKEREKELLIHRLSSLDVSGLGISPIRGRTLVQYAGSLTGGDFRIIAQVAPFVIYDLVGKECYDTWVAISKLVPKIWQREIHDIGRYSEELEYEIEQFLLRTAQWSSQWFNKPKFHILRHLPHHIRRFGPAILFATEGFESFNAVIRAKSVHSNRQAPSRDIADAFAQGNRVRHLLSGGRFFKPAITNSDVPPSLEELSDPVNWVTAGPSVRQLVNPLFDTGRTIASYLGLPLSSSGPSGRCVSDKVPERAFSQTLAGKMFPSPQEDRPVKTFLAAPLPSDDTVKLGDHVLYAAPGGDGALSWNIGLVKELLQFKGGRGEQQSAPDSVLLQLVSPSAPSPKYQMPSLVVTQQFSLVQFKDVKCTVNVQHNCHTNGCRTSGTRIVRQERQDSMHTIPTVEHKNHPEDLILNVCQMRNAAHISHFCVPSIRLSFDDVVLASARREVDRRKAKKNASAPATSNPRGGRATPASWFREGAASHMLGNSSSRPTTPRSSTSQHIPSEFSFVVENYHPF